MLIYRLFVLINFINFVIPTSLENKVKLVNMVVAIDRGQKVKVKNHKGRELIHMKTSSFPMYLLSHNVYYVQK